MLVERISHVFISSILQMTPQLSNNTQSKNTLSQNWNLRWNSGICPSSSLRLQIYFFSGFKGIQVFSSKINKISQRNKVLFSKYLAQTDSRHLAV